jgi:3D (Asp-Asp-Asp) domain-containing protein
MLKQQDLNFKFEPKSSSRLSLWKYQVDDNITPVLNNVSARLVNSNNFMGDVHGKSNNSRKLNSGDIARNDHESIIYGALLEECSDHKACSGSTEGCLKAHSWSSWQSVRRDPRVFNYGSKICSFFSEGSCQKGDQCSFAHSKAEVQFHPKVYKTQACNRYPGSRPCANKLCAFYHIFEDGSDDQRSQQAEVTSVESGGILFSGSPEFEAIWGLKKNEQHHFSVKSDTSDEPIVKSDFSIFKSPVPVLSSIDRNEEYSVLKSYNYMAKVEAAPKSSSNIAMISQAENHWNMKFLEEKMKNPNRRDSQFGLNLLAWVPDFPLRELINILSDENWTIEQLRSYLSHTLVRALEEKKVLVGKMGNIVGFNTGLLHPKDKYSFIAILTYNPVSSGSKFEWTLSHFKSPDDPLVSSNLSYPPKLVNYWDGKCCRYFDSAKQFLPFGSQLLARVMDRIVEVRPEFSSFDPVMQMAIFEKAMKNAQKAVHADSQLAVPSFYRPKGQLLGSVQFLIPISFSDDVGKVDGALAVQERPTGYVACTILTLPSAYAHARLLGRPFSSWLVSSDPNLPSQTSAVVEDCKILLEQYNGLTIHYYPSTVPRLIISDIEDDRSSSDSYSDVVSFCRKLRVKEVSIRKTDISGKSIWEVYLNHSDYISVLQKYKQNSSIDAYMENLLILE